MCNQREKFLKRFSHDCVSRWIIYTGERVMMNLIMSSGTRGGVCVSSSSSRWWREEASKNEITFSIFFMSSFYHLVAIFMGEFYLARRKETFLCRFYRGTIFLLVRLCSTVMQLSSGNLVKRDSQLTALTTRPLDYSRLFIFLHCRAENKIGSLASGARGL